MTGEGSSISKAILGAGLLVAVAVGLATTGLVDGATADRIMILLLGALLVGVGNSLPKTLRPLSARRCVSSREQALRRLSGWVFVLTGLAWILAWLVLPLEAARAITRWTAIGSLLLAAGHVGWCVVARARAIAGS